MTIVKNEKKLRKKFEKDPMFVVELPNIKKGADGMWHNGGDMVEISSLAEFNAYIQDNEELYEILKRDYPAVISTIWKNTFAKLTGDSTIASKMLHGGVISYDKIIANQGFDEYQDTTFNYIIAKVNGQRKVGTPVQIKPYKKTKKEVMKMLGAGKEGYFLPELSDKGAVVVPTKESKLSVRFFAVSADEYTEEQVKEYLLANAMAEYDLTSGNMAETEAVVDAMIEKSKLAYAAIQSGRARDVQDLSEEINFMSSLLYQPDFSEIEEQYGKKKVHDLGEIDTPDFEDDFEDDLGSDDFEDTFEDEKPEQKGLTEIVVEGKTLTDTDVDELGKIVLTITSKGGLAYETRYENEGQRIRFVPVDESQNQKQ